MPEIVFEVEQAITVTGRGAVVLARPLQELLEFSLSPEATLDGYPLRPMLDIPRVIEADSGRRLDLFAFTLLRAEDLAYFTPGRQVVLKNEGGPSVAGVSTPDQAQESFAVHSTDPAAWYELARTLRMAAEPIQRRLFEIAEIPQNLEGIRLEKLAYVRAYMLLTGLAFENLLKAIGLLRHQSIKERGGHGLVGMAQSLALDLAPAERDYLGRLEEYVVWAGRYPVSRKAGTYVTSERRGLLTFRSDDPQVSETLFEKLAAQLTQSS
jgi:hypothetical protein